MNSVKDNLENVESLKPEVKSKKPRDGHPWKNGYTKTFARKARPMRVDSFAALKSLYGQRVEAEKESLSVGEISKDLRPGGIDDKEDGKLMEG